MHRIKDRRDLTFVKPVERKKLEVNYREVPWSNFPMILDTRRGRVWSERRVFQLDRLSTLLLFFSEQVEGSSDPGLPVPVGTGGDITFVVDVGLRVLDDEGVVLVPSSPPPEDAASVATGPPGKTYSALGSKMLGV